MGQYFEISNTIPVITIKNSATPTVTGTITPSLLSLTFGTDSNHPLILKQGGGTRLTLNAADIQASVQLKTISGSAATPAIDVGGSNGLFYNSGLAFTTGGTQRIRIDSSGTISVFSDIGAASQTIGAGILTVGSSGSATNPNLYGASDTNTGLYWNGSFPDTVFLTTGGSLLATFDSNLKVNKGQLITQNGTSSLPAITFTGDPDTGLYWTTSGYTHFTSNTVPVLRVGYNGTQGIIEGLVGDTRFGTSASHMQAENYRIRFSTNGTYNAFDITTNNGTTQPQLAFQNNGTAASPCLSRGADLDTGLFFPILDTIAFSTAGVERVRISDVGNLSIDDPTNTLHKVVINDARNVITSSSALRINQTDSTSTGNGLHIVSARTSGTVGTGALVVQVAGGNYGFWLRGASPEPHIEMKPDDLTVTNSSGAVTFRTTTVATTMNTTATIEKGAYINSTTASPFALTVTNNYTANAGTSPFIRFVGGSNGGDTIIAIPNASSWSNILTGYDGANLASPGLGVNLSYNSLSFRETGGTTRTVLGYNTGSDYSYLYQLGGSLSLGASVLPKSKVHVQTSFGLKTVTKTADYTAAEEVVIYCDATSNNITITLPAASNCTDRIYVIKKIDSSANTVTIDANASETIDGATTKVISTQYGQHTISCNGSNWFII